MPRSAKKDKRTGRPYRNRAGLVFLRLTPEMEARLEEERASWGDDTAQQTIRRVLCAHFGLDQSMIRGRPPGRPRRRD